MTKTHDYEVFADESPTELHHKDCEHTPDSIATGDATADVVIDPERYAEAGEEFDVSCDCLEPFAGGDADA